MYKTYKERRAIYEAKKKVYAEKIFDSYQLDTEFIEDERLEKTLLMKKLKEVDINMLHEVTDVAQLVTGKKVRRNKWDYPSTYYYQEKKTENTKPNYEWVYRIYKRYGNVLVAPETYKKLDLDRLVAEGGKYKTQISPSNSSNDKDCYILWRI